MNFQDWYTDRMDVFRIQDVRSGSLTRRERTQVATGVPCRIYQSTKPAVSLQSPAASVRGISKLMCGLAVDLRAGDELMVTRGGTVKRYFAGEPVDYPEPFGGVLTGLAHKELSISEEEWT